MVVADVGAVDVGPVVEEGAVVVDDEYAVVDAAVVAAAGSTAAVAVEVHADAADNAGPF